MSPFFSFLFFCGYSFLQIQTSDRQRLSMFWSPEWIFPVHPSVRLFFFFFEVWGGVRGCSCVWARAGKWVGARNQTHISHHRPNILMLCSTFWSTVPVISISRFICTQTHPSLGVYCYHAFFLKLTHISAFPRYSLCSVANLTNAFPPVKSTRYHVNFIFKLCGFILKLIWGASVAEQGQVFSPAATDCSLNAFISWRVM